MSEEIQLLIASMVKDELVKERNGGNSKGVDLASPEPFNGTASKLDGFLQECKLHFVVKPEVYRTEDRKAGFVLSHMKHGDAGRWKEAYLKARESAVDNMHPFTLAPNGRFEDFERELRKAFKQPYKKENALLRLQKIQQGKDMIDTHNINFQLLIDETGLDPLMNGEVLIQYYANSLNHHIRDKILTSEVVPENLKGWFAKAAAFDNAYQRLRGYQFGGGGHRKEHRKEKRNFHFNGGRKDPDAMDVDAMSLEEKKRRIKNGACFTCGETGHYSNKCPTRRSNRDKKEGNDKKRETSKAFGKRKMDVKQLRTHIRGIIAENFDTDPAGLEEFLDEVEDEGF